MKQYVLMNSLGELGLGFRVQWYEPDLMEEKELANLDGYSLTLRGHNEHDAWVVFCGEPESDGPWVHVKKEAVDGRMEVVCEL